MLLQTTMSPAVQMHRHTFCIRVSTCPVASKSTSPQPMATAVTSAMTTPRQLISVLANTAFAAMTAMLPITRCCASPSFLRCLPAFHPRLPHVKCCFPHLRYAESMGKVHTSCDRLLVGLAYACMLVVLLMYLDSPAQFNAVSDLYLSVHVMMCCSTKVIRPKHTCNAES